MRILVTMHSQQENSRTFIGTYLIIILHHVKDVLNLDELNSDRNPTLLKVKSTPTMTGQILKGESHIIR